MQGTGIDLTESLKRAAYLMSPEGQKQVDFARKQNAKRYNSDGVFEQPSGSYNMRNTTQTFKNSGSGLPKVIQESIMNNPIEDKHNNYSVGASVLDSIGYFPKQQEVNKPAHSNDLYEQQRFQNQYLQQPQMMGIDYNYIKMIVNECVQENLKQIKEEIIKESALKTIRIAGENKIQLIDNKNNLYESRLEFKKNLSKK